MPCVPRIGETVEMTGPAFGDSHRADADSWFEKASGLIVGVSCLEVVDVIYRDVDKDGCSVECVVMASRYEGLFVPWCECTAEERKQHGVEDGRCRSCSRRQRNHPAGE